jgi:hypothetical protein
MPGIGSSWGTLGWGQFVWGFDFAASPIYFLPPVVKVYPPEDAQTGLENRDWWYRGKENSPVAGYYRIAGVDYRSGVWNGPLTQAQFTAISAAGLDSRMVAAANTGELPVGVSDS